MFFPQTLHDQVVVFCKHFFNQLFFNPMLRSVMVQISLHIFGCIHSRAVNDPQPLLALELCQEGQGLLGENESPARDSDRKDDELFDEHPTGSLTEWNEEIKFNGLLMANLASDKAGVIC
jgi:hypothetical protein